ncbi:MAG: hypothetical protein ACTSWQ_09110 [Candidatus Thorarchaeota archaeon]
METKDQCMNYATVIMVGYDHNIEPVASRGDGTMIIHKGYKVGGEYPICADCVDKLKGWAMFRHYTIRVFPIDQYKPQLEVIASE